MKHFIDIRDDELAIVREILRVVLPKDARVWVFGSRATWTTKRGSDLDLAIDVGSSLTLQERTDLADAFDESDLPYKVDIVDLQTVSEPFKKIIDQSKSELELY